jgi:Zn-dependent protease with chaperone function
MAVIGAWLAMLGIGILLVMAGTGLVFMAFGVLMIVLTIVTRPRVQPAPEHALTRADAPELYRLVDDIATELGAPRVAVIGAVGDWNAATYRFGLRQRTAIVIGLPYWHALADQERVAVLAHEVAHTVNGDTTRGIIQGNAGLMLWHWAFMTEPDDIVDASGGLIALASVPANLAMLGLSMALAGLSEGLFALGFPTRLRAELYADRLGAGVAGRDAILGLQSSLYLDAAYERALAAVTIRKPPAADLYDELLVQVAATPASELERLRRKERADPFTFDQTHPPTPEREAMTRRLPTDRPPRIVMTAERMAAIDAELATVRPAVTRELIAEYRDAVLG